MLHPKNALSPTLTGSGGWCGVSAPDIFGAGPLDQ